MDANTFFGYNSGSCLYDKRRHLNFFFFNYIQYNLNVNSSIRPFYRTLINLLQNNELDKAYEVCTKGLLIPIQIEFLQTIRVRLGLSIDEYKAILTGQFLNSMVKTPAGYSRLDNMKLFIDCVVSTMFMQPQVQQETNKFYDSCLKCFSIYFSTDEMVELIGVTNQIADRYAFSVESILDNIEAIENEVIGLT